MNQMCKQEKELDLVKQTVTESSRLNNRSPVDYKLGRDLA